MVDEVALRRIADQIVDLLVKKNRDYGDIQKDIFGELGILVRLNDKIRRALTISKNSVVYVRDESLRDTIVDLAGYCLLYLERMDS